MIRQFFFSLSIIWSVCGVSQAFDREDARIDSLLKLCSSELVFGWDSKNPEFDSIRVIQHFDYSRLQEYSAKLIKLDPRLFKKANGEVKVYYRDGEISRISGTNQGNLGDIDMRLFRTSNNWTVAVLKNSTGYLKGFFVFGIPWSDVVLFTVDKLDVKIIEAKYQKDGQILNDTDIIHSVGVLPENFSLNNIIRITEFDANLNLKDILWLSKGHVAAVSKHTSYNQPRLYMTESPDEVCKFDTDISNEFVSKLDVWFNLEDCRYSPIVFLSKDVKDHLLYWPLKLYD